MLNGPIRVVLWCRTMIRGVVRVPERFQVSGELQISNVKSAIRRMAAQEHERHSVFYTDEIFLTK